jgi:PcfJ-like protein
MIEQLGARIELLRDGKGIYGICAKGLPETWQHLKPIITRPDRVSECELPLYSALQMIPPKPFKRTAEYLYIRALMDSWGEETKKKVGLENLPPNHYLALSSRCRLIVDSAIRQALAVGNTEHLRTARRYPLEYRFPIYRACCVYGAPANQIAATFPAAAMVAYGICNGVVGVEPGDVNFEAWKAKSVEICDLVQKGAPLKLIADVFNLPKIVRHICPTNVLIAPWQCLRLYPEFLFYMPRTIHKQRRWFYALTLATRRGVPGEVKEWVARHGLELGKSRRIISSRLIDVVDWVVACREKMNEAELEALSAEFDVLVRKAQTLGKDIRNPLPMKVGAKFVTRVFTSNMSASTVQTLCDEWHEAVSMADFVGKNTVFPAPWYEGGQISGYTITPIRSRIELFREGRAMHNCCLTYAERIMSGTCFFYSVTKDGERYATLMIRDEAGQTVLGDLRTVCNGMADRKLKTAVNEWLGRNQQLYGNGQRPGQGSKSIHGYRSADEEIAFLERVLNE